MTTAHATDSTLTELKPGNDLRRVAACADALLAQSRTFADHARAHYAAPCASMFNGTIGAHLRHNLDHFGAALGACSRPETLIDYDHRERGTPVESEPDAAIEVIDALRARLRDLLDGRGEDHEVSVRMMLTAGGEEAALRSTLTRELAFAAHHAVHHHAMMAAIAHAHGLTIPAGFGKAPSTLNHESGRVNKA
ncbi:MAG: hypothetical protein ACTS27_06645 [Phycisphaerales bacterium]